MHVVINPEILLTDNDLIAAHTALCRLCLIALTSSTHSERGVHISRLSAYFGDVNSIHNESIQTAVTS